ncbi:MAG: hypothetical protein ABJX82_18645 [Paracoccaceae bacterium]
MSGDSAAADGASGPLGVAERAAGASPVPVVGAWDMADVADVITVVPATVSAQVREKNHMIHARGAAAAGGVEAADSFGPLEGGAAVASMLVTIPVRVYCEM